MCVQSVSHFHQLCRIIIRVQVSIVKIHLIHCNLNDNNNYKSKYSNIYLYRMYIQNLNVYNDIITRSKHMSLKSNLMIH